MSTTSQHKVCGIILAGGKGIRLGRNKGMAKLGGRHLIEYVIENLSAVCDDILISSNTDQCRQFGFPVIADRLAGKGPMAGMHACLSASPHNDNLIVSVDAPFAGPEFFEYLLSRRENARIAAPWDGKDHYEPLCAYYHRSVSGIMEEFMAMGKYKLMNLFEATTFSAVEIPADAPFYHPFLFHNINTEEDLLQAERYLQERAQK